MERQHIERTAGWMDQQKRFTEISTQTLLNVWGLKKPVGELDVPHKKMAGFVLETLLASFGLKFESGLFEEIVDSFYPELNDTLQGKMTVNHKSLAARISGNGIVTGVKYAPVLTSPLELGSISPLKVKKNNGIPTVDFESGDVL